MVTLPQQEQKLTLAQAVDMGLPIVQSNGVGVDSVAVVVGMVARGIRPNHVLFADVGCELPETYDYIPVLNEYLEDNGFPTVTVVQYAPKTTKRDMYDSLETDCLTKSMFPSLTFGYKGCSNKWKVGPLDKWVGARYKEHLKAGNQVVRLIGYDDGPKDCARGTDSKDSGKWRFVYPLRDWGWDRDECIHQIEKAGLPVPIKSACFFCPSTKKDELIWLALTHPGLARRALLIEAKAIEFVEGHMNQTQLDERHKQRLTEHPKKVAAAERRGKKPPKLPKHKTAGQNGLIRGLWGADVLGTRDPNAKKPGMWSEFLQEKGLFDRVMAHEDLGDEDEYFGEV